MTDDDAPTASFAIPNPDVGEKALVVYDRENHQGWLQAEHPAPVRR
jgi:hypothetical protein